MNERMKRKSLVYGPVTSRRLGLSLGVDTVPYKMCSFDCLYCQIGRTVNTTVRRADFGLSERIFQDLGHALESGIPPDHITLGGSGEPTLNLELGRIIQGIKRMTAIPVAVLTNSSLLWDQDVRNELLAADVVLPSLDAADEQTYHVLNRPHPDIPFDRFVEGLCHFSLMFPGRVWLEVFLVKHINASGSHLEKLKRLIGKIKPDRVHLNTVVRPPADASIEAVEHAELSAIAAGIGGNAEVIAEYRDKGHGPRHAEPAEDEILAVLLRRPSTVRQVATALRADEKQVGSLIDRLVSEARVSTEQSGKERYYFCVAEPSGDHSL